MKPKSPLSIYDDLTEKIAIKNMTDVFEDLELLNNNWKIYYIIDHHELTKYCFPIDVDKTENYTEKEIKSISNDQIGYFELFINNLNKPILLEEYKEELEGLINYLDIYKTEVFSQTSILKRYISEVGISEQDFKDLSGTSEFLEFIKKNYNKILAITAGLYNIGTERLTSILKNKISFNTIPEVEPHLLKRINPSDNATLFYQMFNNFYSNDPFYQRAISHDPFKKFDIEYNNKIDARVIDKVFQLNDIFNPQKILFLYVSSARKSSHLLTHSSVAKFFPTIENKPKNILRTTQHFFAYSVFVNDKIPINSTLEKLKKLIEKLTEFTNIRDTFKNSERTCENCLKDESRISEFFCVNKHICLGLRELDKLIYTKESEELANMELVFKSKSFLEKFENNVSEKGYTYFITFIQSLSENQNIKNSTKSEIIAINQILNAKITFASLISSDISEFDKRFFMKENVTCILQEYPNRIKIQNQELNKILDNIWSFVRIPKTQRGKQISLLNQALGDFIKIDAELFDSIEGEITRMVLYIVLQETSMIDNFINNFSSIVASEKNRIYESELLFLLIYSLFYRKRISEALNHCNISIFKYSSDPRFFHLKSMLNFLLMIDERKNCADFLPDIISTAETALTLYEKDPEMVAVNCNNLAYFYSYNCNKTKNLSQADEYLNQLLDLFPLNTWDPNFPEFYDTLAQIEYEKSMESGNIDKNSNLKSAIYHITKAFEIYPKESYKRKLKLYKRGSSQ